MNVHAIISTRNGSEWIEKCLESLINASNKINIHVIDNVSSDDTVEIVRSKFPSVNLVVNTTDMGFGQANNFLMRIALAHGADYVFLLNQDAWVEPDTIDGLIKAHQQHPGFGILSPIHLTGSGKAMDRNFSRYCDMDNCPGFLSDLYLQQTKDIYPIKFVNGALWLISRECLEAVGLFDPLFHVYVEDIDFVSRAKHKGFKIGIVPAYRGYHDRENRGTTPPQKKRRIRYLSYKSQLKDPNHSFKKALGSYYALHFERLFTSLVRLRNKEFADELKTGVQILFAMKGILNSRRASKRNGAYISNK